MSGSNYFISVKQVLESEKKLRLVGMLKNSGLSIADLNLQLNCDQSTLESDHTLQCDLEISHSDVTFQLSDGELNIIYYVSGYVGRSCTRFSQPCCQRIFIADNVDMPEVDMDNTTPECSDAQAFFKIINRGGLKRPTDIQYIYCSHIYSAFCILKNKSCFFDFLSSSSASLDFGVIAEKFVSFYINIDIFCSHGHSCLPIFRKEISTLFNTLCKKYRKDYTLNKLPSSAAKITKLKSGSIA